MSNLELNKGDNIIFELDVSRSMMESDTPSGLSRLAHTVEGVVSFIGEANKYDTDGVNVSSFGVKVTPLGKLTADNARSILSGLQANEPGTRTDLAILDAWKQHQAGGYEQSVCFIITDGEPNDEDAVFRTIANITSEFKPGADGKINEHQFAISFLTVGVRSPGLQAFLTKLDDALPGAKFDIVDVKELDKVDFATAFDGALHD